MVGISEETLEMKKYHKVKNLKFDSDFLILNIDGEKNNLD